MNAPRALALLLVFSVATATLAATAAPRPAGKSYQLNPKSLQSMIVRRNIPVLKGLARLHQAKDSVNIARANLLPHLNLGMLFGGKDFAISSISFLLPFLLPSNWARLRESKALLEAEKLSYHLMGLNQFASAFSVYATVVNDLELRAILLSQYEDLVRVRNWLINRRDTLGTVPQQDIDSADAQARLAYSALSQMDVLLLKERSAMRELLALNLNDTMVFEPMHVPELAAESFDAETLAKKIHSLAPESQQMVYLVAAAKSGRWSRNFAFLGGSNLNVTKDSSSGKWNGVSLGSTLNLGFDMVPNIRLTNNHILEIQLQARELQLQQAHLAEDTLGAIREAKLQLENNSIARDQLSRVYEAELNRYMLGLTDLRTVLDARLRVAQGASAAVRARLDLDTLRITLHRALISDLFKDIPRCQISRQAEEYDRKQFWKNLFNPNSGGLSIDEACLPSR